MRILFVACSLASCVGLIAQGEKPPVAGSAQKATQGKVQKKVKPVVKRLYAVIETSLGDITVELFADETPNTVANFLGLAEGTKASLDPKTGKMTKRHFYDGITFHRVIKGFMAQTGCPDGTGSGGPGFEFGDEMSAKALGLDKIMVVENGRRNYRGCSLTQENYNKHVVAPLVDDLGITTRKEFENLQNKLQEMIEKTTVLSVYKRLGFQYDDSRKTHPMQRGTLAMANVGPGTNGSQFFINFKNNEHFNGKHTVFGRVVAGMKVVDKMQAVKIDRWDRPTPDLKLLSIRSAKRPAELRKDPASKRAR